MVALQPGDLGAQKSPPAAASPQRALLDQYCVTCHNQRLKTGGLMLDNVDPARPAEHAEIWEKAIRKLRGGLMPPPGVRQPDKAAVESFIASLETGLDQAAAATPNPGRVALHRLNRAEYANAVRDLFGISVDSAALLPADDISEGFDNIASVLKVSPSFLDQYVTAARAVTIEAVGAPPPSEPVRVTLRGGSPDLAAEVPGGAPLGTRAVIFAEHLFPADGEYEFRFQAGGRPGAPPPDFSGFFVTLDGAKVPVTGRVRVKAGLHKVAVVTPARSLVETEANLYSFIPGNPGIVYGATLRAAPVGVNIAGPHNPESARVETVSRQRIFVCRPPNASEELPCARRILSNIARRAFRRGVTDQDVAAALAFFSEERKTGNFETAIQAGLTAILASPKFLYRAEPAPKGAAPGSAYRVGDLELASRLSFFLWSSIPDEELLGVAEQGKLKDPAVFDRQVRRMLADPRAKSLVTNFAFQWLKVRDLEKAEPDPIQFPGYDLSLRNAFRREMEMLLESIVREDRSALDLLRADYTFVNERLAAHYGIPDVRGDQFRRVTLTDSNRWGILGKGAMLMVTSYPNRTSAVLRGAWILENITGTPPAAPPPDVEAFQENKEGEKARTVREIMEQHRAKPTCNACHGIIDPLGFALENFDAIGEWRSQDRWARNAIDASGKLVDGTPVSGPADLRKALLGRPRQFVETMTEKMLTYALGRSLEASDMPAVRRIVRDAARRDYRISALIDGIVNSAPFQWSRAPEATEPRP
jgi:mono/diheme cytochrome c family protein